MSTTDFSLKNDALYGKPITKEIVALLPQARVINKAHEFDKLSFVNHTIFN